MSYLRLLKMIFKLLKTRNAPRFLITQQLKTRNLSFIAAFGLKTPSSTLLYATLRYSKLLYATLSYSTPLYSTLLYATLLYATLRYSTLLYATLRYSTLLLRAIIAVCRTKTKVS
jgi:hypothetical protein